jgi:protoheme IX farnesyltransferase
LITGGANALNQIFEREWDSMMKRTAQRPLPTAQLTIKQAAIFAVCTGLLGVGLISYFFNLPAALLGIIGYLSYSFVYTPLKRISPFSVFIGAIPGALPPLIGWVAITGALDPYGLMLFAFQFLWQFPHFWAIAWIAHEDYSRAGFKMLPSAEGKTPFSASVILWYTLSLIPLPFLPYTMGMIPVIQAGILALIGLYFALPALRLARSLGDADARKLMFASFFYLPLIQLTFLVGAWLV